MAGPEELVDGDAESRPVGEGNRREVMAVDGGFLQVSRDQVIVLAEYAILPSEVDAAANDAEIEELRRRIAAEEGSAELKRELARAEAVHAIARM